jgi:hypothetical protein
MRTVQLSFVLTDLIAFTEEVLRGPQMHPKAPQSFAELAAEIAARHAQPAEGVRATRAGVIMVTALDGFFADQDDSWLMLAGATLPLLRREAWTALVGEREARVSEQAGGYRR